ncbi:hypothetical protein EPN90_04055 [Patescibacteria group bacterium]|nr:MAG: hypothetical protein EPN90_04055 [Patescibacteria group bacterium]
MKLQIPNSKIRNAERGQGLLEMIVAIGIITTGVLGTLTLVSATIVATGESEGRLVAGNLAREAVEVVRNIRDSNWLAGKNWEEGLVGLAGDRSAAAFFGPATASWTLDFSPNGFGSAATLVYRLNSPPFEDVFVQSAISPGGASLTPYERLIFLYPICRDEPTNSETVVAADPAACPPPFMEVGLDVRAEVRWRVKGGIRSVIAEEKIYDWR